MKVSNYCHGRLKLYGHEPMLVGGGLCVTGLASSIDISVDSMLLCSSVTFACTICILILW